MIAVAVLALKLDDSTERDCLLRNHAVGDEELSKVSHG